MRQLAGGAFGILFLVVLIAVFARSPAEEAPPTTQRPVDTTSRATVTSQPATTVTTEVDDVDVTSPSLLPGHEDLLSLFVFPDDDVCEPVPAPPSDAEFEVRCEDPEPQVVVSYQIWSSREEMEGRLAFHQEESETSARRWSLAGVRQGRLIPYVDEEGNAVRFWTYEGHSEGWLSGEAVAPDPESLTSWWMDTGNRLADEPILTGLEQDLISLLEFADGSRCVAVRPGQTDHVSRAQAQLASCRVDAGDFTVSVSRALWWESFVDLNAFWEELSEQTGGSVEPWEGGSARGRVLRFQSGENPGLAWSDDDVTYLVQVTTSDGSAEQLEDWWESIR